MKVIDNFLLPDQFKLVSDYMMGPYCTWSYNPFVDYQNSIFSAFDLDDYQFIHNFSIEDSILFPLVERLNIKEVVRIKANLNPRTSEIVERKFHTDVDDKCKTAVFYINTNNGWTEFEDGSKVESVANRVVIFDSHTKHKGTTCSDQKTRVVINFNYYEG